MTTLFPGQSLYPGYSLQSNNKLFTLTMQTDGNVVLYDRQRAPLWSTKTGGLIQPREFAMQTNGDLVLWDTSGAARWLSHSGNNPGAFLNVQDDGNLVVYRAGSQTETANNALWSAGSNVVSSVPNAPNGVAQALLDVHNRLRAAVGVPPLRWSESLAASALEWATVLATQKRFEHSGGPYGENLEAASAGAWNAAQLCEDWINEGALYSSGVFPNVSRDGRWQSVGHYTQMIWRNTTEVGGAVATANGTDVLVCHYNPAGNVTGQTVI